MSRRFFTAIGCLLMFASMAPAQTDFREALRLAFPATVSVETEQDGQANANARVLRRQMGQFGGFQLIDNFGVSPTRVGFAVGADMIVTQISSDIDEVTIKTVEGKQLPGKVISRDYVTGLTLVRIDGTQFVSLVVGAGVPEAGVPIVVSRLSDSGTPKGELGMIASGPSTADSQLGFTQYISAVLNRSDAGAPIIDATGVVVGVVGVGSDGSMLCLPTAQVTTLIENAAAGDPTDLKRGLIGIQFRQFADDNDPVVTAISDGTPAEEAGLKSGDLITRVGDYEIRTSHDVLAAVAMSRADDDVPITVQRGDDTFELVVELGLHPRQEFVVSGVGSTGAMAQKAWELRDGKLVPLEGGDAGAPAIRDRMQKDLGKLFENFPNNNLILPGLPKRLEGFKVERSELEDALQKLESQKKDQADQIDDLQKKLRDLQDKMKDS